MKLTNRHNLPESVYNLLSKDRYVGGNNTDYSVTTLLQPPRITQLKRRHWDKLEEDVMDNVWSLFGSVAHSLLEEHGSDNALSEERVYANILDRNISGQVDSYHLDIITDYKVTSAWTLVYKSRLKEWEEQLNMYAYLFKYNGHTVKELRICAILRDWDKNTAKRDKNYPQTPIVMIPIPLWTMEEQECFIYGRVVMHKDAELMTDLSLPPCSEEDMWCQPTKFALMKKDGKRAIKLHDTTEEAELHLEQIDPCKMNRDIYEVRVRQGKRTRCEGYCSVCSFCNIYQAYLREQECDV
jgi:hypothetical protein